MMGVLMETCRGPAFGTRSHACWLVGFYRIPSLQEMKNDCKILSDNPHLCEDDPIAPSQACRFYPLNAAKVKTKTLK